MSLKLTLMAVATVGFLFGLTSSAPVKSVFENGKILNATEVEILQKCLYQGPHVAGNLSGAPKGKGNLRATAFCARLYNFSHTDAHRERMELANFTTRELTLRNFFYVELGHLWRFYQRYSACLLLQRNRTRSTEWCLNEDPANRYKGLFPEDFASSSEYQLGAKVAQAVVRYNPALRTLEHCFHLHNIWRSEPAAFYQASTRYAACRTMFRKHGWGSLDALQAEAVVSSGLLKEWRARAADRHFELQFNEENEGNGGIYGIHYEPEPKLSWAELEDQIYAGLYNSSPSNGASIFGPTVVAKRGKTWRRLNRRLLRNWRSTDVLFAELTPQQRRLRDHLKSNLVADRLYDCWKFHLDEEEFWCEGLTPFDSVSGLAIAPSERSRINNATVWNLSGLTENGNLTGPLVISERYMAKVRKFVEAERLAEQAAITDVSSHLLAFLALPEKIVSYCRFDRLVGWQRDVAELDPEVDWDCTKYQSYQYFFEQKKKSKKMATKKVWSDPIPLGPNPFAKWHA